MITKYYDIWHELNFKGDYRSVLFASRGEKLGISRLGYIYPIEKHVKSVEVNFLGKNTEKINIVFGDFVIKGEKLNILEAENAGVRE